MLAIGVYPRVGGGNEVWVGVNDFAQGLSPRGRGKLDGVMQGKPIHGSIPAWAGETPGTVLLLGPV